MNRRQLESLLVGLIASVAKVKPQDDGQGNHAPGPKHCYPLHGSEPFMWVVVEDPVADAQSGLDNHVQQGQKLIHCSIQVGRVHAAQDFPGAANDAIEAKGEEVEDQHSGLHMGEWRAPTVAGQWKSYQPTHERGPHETGNGRHHNPPLRHRVSNSDNRRIHEDPRPTRAAGGRATSINRGRPRRCDRWPERLEPRTRSSWHGRLINASFAISMAKRTRLSCAAFEMDMSGLLLSRLDGRRYVVSKPFQSQSVIRPGWSRASLPARDPGLRYSSTASDLRLGETSCTQALEEFAYGVHATILYGRA